jgi:hypothetical protein
MSRVEIHEQESKIQQGSHGDVTTTATIDGHVWGISYLVPTLICKICVEFEVVGNGLVYQHRTNPNYQDLGPWRLPLVLMCLVCPVPNTYVGMQSCIPAMMW